MPHKSSKRHQKRTRRKNRDNEVTTRDKPATVGRGSAQGDAITSLPLLGHKFEIKRMLYYDSRFELTGAGGILQTHYFRANDVFDPDASGVGHQPIGFDQAMLFWEQFAVFSSKITVTFRSNNADATRVGVFLNPDTTNPTIQGIMENGYVKSNIVVGTNSVGLGFHTIKKINMSCNNVRYFQMKNKETYFANPNFIGNVAATPTEMVYFGVFAFNPITTTTTDVLFDVELSYDVRFQEPRKISPSLLSRVRELQLDDLKLQSDAVLVDTDFKLPQPLERVGNRSSTSSGGGLAPSGCVQFKGVPKNILGCTVSEREEKPLPPTPPKYITQSRKAGP